MERPELFDAVATDADGRIEMIEVKAAHPRTRWIWGAFKMPGRTLHALASLWRARDRSDAYIGTLVNAWIAAGGEAWGVRAGESYVDVGTLNGFREASLLLDGRTERATPIPLGTRPARKDARLMPNWTEAAIRARAAELGPWFHNLDLRGVQTAPDHFLGDYPAVKWRSFADAIPADLAGRSVLDIGCNAGFYAMEMKRRGAERVVGIDFDDDYLAQARFAAEVAGTRHPTSRNCPSMTWARSASASTSCCSSACCTICAIRCWRWI